MQSTDPILVPIAFDNFSDEEPVKTIILPVPDACVVDGTFSNMSSFAQNEFYPINAYENKDGVPGLLFEHAQHFEDVMAGNETVLLGGDNKKDGADRSVNGILVQCKVLRDAVKTARAMFTKSGDLRYKDSDGRPLIFEVAKDQYEDIVAFLVKEKAEGHPGLKQIESIESLLKKGAYTRAECIAMCQAGTFSGIIYDVKTGLVPACASGLLTFWVDVASNDRPNWSRAFCASAKGSIFHLVTHISTCQLGRMGCFKLLRKPIEKALKCAPKDIVHSIVNLGRAKPIHGAAAQKFASKFIRVNLISNAVIWIGYSTLSTIELAQNKISIDEYACALLQSGSSIVAGTAGAQIGAIVGGMTMGPIGAVIGGTIVSIASAVVADQATGFTYDKIRSALFTKKDKDSANER